MNYIAQTKLLFNEIKKNPDLKMAIRFFRKNWANQKFYNKRFKIGYVFISDKVIREIDI